MKPTRIASRPRHRFFLQAIGFKFLSPLSRSSLSEAHRDFPAFGLKPDRPNVR
jgi:hypothetical protein